MSTPLEDAIAWADRAATLLRECKPHLPPDLWRKISEHLRPARGTVDAMTNNTRGEPHRVDDRHVRRGRR